MATYYVDVLYNQTALELAVFGASASLTLLTTLVTFLLAHRHLTNYSDPVAQRHILFIIMLPVVYSVDSVAAILWFDYAVYFGLLCDCYEALVLYQFFCLLVHYFNVTAADYFAFPSNACEMVPLEKRHDDAPFLSEEDENGLYRIEVTTTAGASSSSTYTPPIRINDDGHEEMDIEAMTVETTSTYLCRVDRPRHPFPCCCVAMQPGRGLFLRLRAGVLQYVVVKVVLSLLAAVLHMCGVYRPGSFDPRYGYLWISVVAMNLSIFVAMYCLLVFYMLIHTIVKQFHPLRKLIAIKFILFVLFWQSVALALLYYSGLVPSLFIAELGGPEESASVIDNLLACCEMFCLALTHFYVFPYEYYRQQRQEQQHVYVEAMPDDAVESVATVKDVKVD